MIPRSFADGEKGADRTAPPTIATIASSLGLSRSTVTHVLRGRADEQRIRPETQMRVLEAARSVGYRTNVSARAIRTGRFGSIALVQAIQEQYLPPELLWGLMNAIADKDMHLVMTQVSDATIDDEGYLPHAIKELSVDGVIINKQSGFSQLYLQRIRDYRVPAVFVNSRMDNDCVYPDEIMGGRIATEFLLGLNHERIAFITTEGTEFDHFSRIDRKSGYEQAMISAGKTPWLHVLPKHWEMPGRTGMDLRIEACTRILAHDDRPTGIVAYELAESMAVVHAARVLGLRIPEDLSIIHFHHRIDDRYFIPFHTMSNRMELIGNEAVSMLLEKIEVPAVALAGQAVPTELLPGATCMHCNRERHSKRE